MGIRVLLADESSTIKRVMQLALQDFAVEVKPVPVGVDVVPVAKTFHPDIIFIDVLLAKKSGYDVCEELKSNSELSSIPVILMWSSFMEFDEVRANKAKPDRRLEKPFDADTLRRLIKDLVPSASKNAMADFLTFPDLQRPEIQEQPLNEAPQLVAQAFEESSTPPTDSIYPFLTPSESAPAPIEPLQVHSEFSQVPLPGTSQNSNFEPLEFYTADDQWEQHKLEVKPENKAEFLVANELTDNPDGLLINEMNLDSNQAPNESFGDFNFESVQLKTSNNPLAGLTEAELEQIVRQQVQKIVEEIAWKLIPDLAERIIKEEIAVLLKGVE